MMGRHGVLLAAFLVQAHTEPPVLRYTSSTRMPMAAPMRAKE